MADRVKPGLPSSTPAAIFGAGKRQPKYHIGSGTLTINPKSKLPAIPERGKFEDLRLGSSNPVVLHGKGAAGPAANDDTAEDSDKATVIVRRTLSSPIARSPIPPPEPSTPKILKPKPPETFTIRSLNDHFKSKGVEKAAPAKSWELTTSSLPLDTLVLDPAEIETFPNLPPVERLSLFKCWMSDAQFIALINRVRGTLKELYVNFCFELTAEALKVLPPIEKFEAGTHPPFDDAMFPILLISAKTLNHLSCVGSAITDEGLASAAPQFTNLVSIDLSSCNISGKGFLALAALPLLRQVTITGCAIGEEDIAALYRQNPDAKIYRHYEMCPRPPDLETATVATAVPRHPLRRAHTVSGLLPPPRLGNDLGDDMDALIADVEERLSQPTDVWKESPSTLSPEEKRARARAYLRKNGMLDDDDEALLAKGDPDEHKQEFLPPSSSSSALIAAPTRQRRGSLEDVFYDPRLTRSPSYYGKPAKPLRLTDALLDSDKEATGGPSSGPIVTELPDDDSSDSQQALVFSAATSGKDDEDDFYAPNRDVYIPTLTQAPQYSRSATAPYLAIGPYHPDPRDDPPLAVILNSSAKSAASQRRQGAGTFTAGDRQQFLELNSTEPAPAILLAHDQHDSPHETPTTRAAHALKTFPLVSALVVAREIPLKDQQPVDSILSDVLTALQVRNALLRAQNMESIAVTGSSALRKAETALADLARINSWAEAERALHASETVVNLRRMRPVLAKLWPEWIKQHLKFCGKIPEWYVHFKEFDAIPDEALESAIRWLSKEPLIFTGTKELKFESLPEKLTMIPNCIAEMPLTDLEYLSFDGNEISALPVRCFQKSMQLRTFSIMDNHLRAIPDNLTETWRIVEVLHFSDNRLRALPKKLGLGCDKLKTVLFGSNAIAFIPPEFIAVMEDLSHQKLKVFDVSNNCLKNAESLDALRGILKDPSLERVPDL